MSLILIIRCYQTEPGYHLCQKECPSNFWAYFNMKLLDDN